MRTPHGVGTTGRTSGQKSNGISHPPIRHRAVPSPKSQEQVEYAGAPAYAQQPHVNRGVPCREEWRVRLRGAVRMCGSAAAWSVDRLDRSLQCGIQTPFSQRAQSPAPPPDRPRLAGPHLSENDAQRPQWCDTTPTRRYRYAFRGRPVARQARSGARPSIFTADQDPVHQSVR